MSNNAYDQIICVEGIGTSALDFVIYGTILGYLVCKAGQNKFGKKTIAMLLVPLIQYLLCFIFRILDYSTMQNSYCSIYFFKSWYDWIQEISMITTGIIIQVFMLRNMKVAAVLRAKSI